MSEWIIAHINILWQNINTRLSYNQNQYLHLKIANVLLTDNKHRRQEYH